MAQPFSWPSSAVSSSDRARPSSGSDGNARASFCAPAEGAPPPPQPPPAMVPEATSKLTPTHVLCLRNLLNAEIMADATELAECVDDIRDECESFGKLAAFVVPTQAELHGHSAADLGACFVKYEALVSAAKAQQALDGRDFDGNSVSATFLPDDSM